MSNPPAWPETRQMLQIQMCAELGVGLDKADSGFHSTTTLPSRRLFSQQLSLA